MSKVIYDKEEEDMMFELVVGSNPHLADQRKFFKLHSHVAAGPAAPKEPDTDDKKILNAYKRRLAAFNKKNQETGYNTEAVVSISDIKQTVRYRRNLLSGMLAAYKEQSGTDFIPIWNFIPEDWNETTEIAIHLQSTIAEFLGVSFYDVEIGVTKMTRKEYFDLKEIKIWPKKAGSAIVLPEEPFILKLKHESIATCQQSPASSDTAISAKM
jgi:hypothetical protein